MIFILNETYIRRSMDYIILRFVGSGTEISGHVILFEEMASVLIWAALFYVLLQQARSQFCGKGSTDCKCLWTDPKTLKVFTLDITNLFAYP